MLYMECGKKNVMSMVNSQLKGELVLEYLKHSS